MNKYIPKESVEYICRKNTVSTNPDDFEAHEKFIQFMDDPEISQFGKWMHANGNNIALVGVQVDLDKIPAADVVPAVHAKWENYSPITIKCSRCGHVIHDWRYSECKYCPNCGAKMDGERKE